MNLLIDKLIEIEIAKMKKKRAQKRKACYVSR